MGALHGSEKKKGPNKRMGEKGPETGRCSGTTFTPLRQQQWLDALAQCGQRSIACTKVGVHRGTVENLLRKSPDFRQRFEDAMLQFREGLVGEAVRRGVKGIDEPIYSRGRRALDIHPEDADKLGELRQKGIEPRLIPASIRRYSDTLLTQLLKAYNQQFSENKPATPVDPLSQQLDDLSPEELKELETLLKNAKARKKDASKTGMP